MRAISGSLARHCLARLKAALRDDGARCLRCGVCHNVCALMGRKPGLAHQARGGKGAARQVLAQADVPLPIDAKAQED